MKSVTIYLDRHYSPPSLKGVENIGIDEFAVKKGHIYKTIVVDLDTGRILYRIPRRTVFHTQALCLT